MTTLHGLAPAHGPTFTPEIHFSSKEVSRFHAFGFLEGVIEFKLGDAAEAMAQIKALKYHQKYQAEGKKIILLGIGFDVENRNIDNYLAEEIK